MNATAGIGGQGALAKSTAAISLTALLTACPLYFDDPLYAPHEAGQPLPQQQSPQPQQQDTSRSCGQTEQTADFGPVQIGTVVVLARHQPVNGDENWSEAMSQYVGQTATVLAHDGVDDLGCPGIRVDIDGEAYFWRARDQQVIGYAAPQPPNAMPQGCGPTAGYGPLYVGAVVVLGRHRPVGGVDNWTAGMENLVGHTARVVELAPADDSGCPGVRIDADGGAWFWRVRDLQLVQ